mmetsp:Transcript_51094/g.59690  ORF Transcript_51094/g.59690 Transcript_51094/m.59690 type:complete len:94 (+) Transcript_51094:30-311(+)
MGCELRCNQTPRKQIPTPANAKKMNRTNTTYSSPTNEAPIKSAMRHTSNSKPAASSSSITDILVTNPKKSAAARLSRCTRSSATHHRTIRISQ